MVSPPVAGTEDGNKNSTEGGNRTVRKQQRREESFPCKYHETCKLEFPSKKAVNKHVEKKHKNEEGHQKPGKKNEGESSTMKKKKHHQTLEKRKKMGAVKTIRCPCCKKLFRTEKDLKDHKDHNKRRL